MARKIKTLLLIDLYGCTALPADILYLCMDQFIREIEQQIAKSNIDARIGNVWGTIIYISCKSEKEGGALALNLRSHLQGLDWKKMTGQDDSLELIMLLHSGPVHASSESTSTEFVVGPYGDLVRRLQLLDAEGQIFTTEEFAALVACEGVEEFQCEYQGLAAGKKSKHSLPVYMLKSSIMSAGWVKGRH